MALYNTRCTRKFFVDVMKWRLQDETLDLSFEERLNSKKLYESLPDIMIHKLELVEEQYEMDTSV